MNGDPSALWSQLRAAGLVSGAMPAHELLAPWYVRLMLGIAGAIAAVFLLGFIAVGFAFVMDSKVASIAVGLMLIVGAYAGFRAAPRSDFANMFALSVSFAGQALLAIGVFELLERAGRGTPWMVLAVVEVVLAVAMPNFIHRLACAYAAGIAVALALAAHGVAPLGAGMLALGVAAVWLNELRFGSLRSTLAPIGYGLTAAYVQVEASNAFGTSLTRFLIGAPVPMFAQWLGQALVIGALVVAAGVLLRRSHFAAGGTRNIVALIATAAIGAASFKAPGVAGGLMIALLGFANGNRLLLGVGIAALLFYVSSYYYTLEATLLAKATVLLATGIVLLAARWLFLNFLMRKGRSDA